MCNGIALAWSELPREMIGRHQLRRRAHKRVGGEFELRFFYEDRFPKLPIRRDGRLQLARWGNGRGQSRTLPRTGWTWAASLEQGLWRDLEPIRVVIPATLAQEKGVWYPVRQGIRGLLVPDERGMAVAYILCRPATSYYQMMTRSDRMPILVEEKI